MGLDREWSLVDSDANRRAPGHRMQLGDLDPTSSRDIVAQDRFGRPRKHPSATTARRCPSPCSSGRCSPTSAGLRSQRRDGQLLQPVPTHLAIPTGPSGAGLPLRARSRLGYRSWRDPRDAPLEQGASTVPFTSDRAPRRPSAVDRPCDARPGREGPVRLPDSARLREMGTPPVRAPYAGVPESVVGQFGRKFGVQEQVQEVADPDPRIRRGVSSATVRSRDTSDALTSSYARFLGRRPPRPDGQVPSPP